jgi:hypothetical protein
MRAAWFLVVVGSTACSYSGVARAVGRTDVILQWNEQVVATGGPQLQRTLAMVHIAVFDAVNAIEPRYRPYLRLTAPPAGTSSDAAAAGAAYGVLTRLFPDQRQPLAAALAHSLSAVPDGPIEDDSVAYGDAAAQAIYDARLNDRILLPDTAIPPRSTPGAYQLTAEHERTINTRAREWVPFALASASQFRPGGPPALTSREYARELAEVRDIGRLAGTRRSPEEEQIARWHLEHGHVQLNRVARAEAASDGRDVLDHARLFALRSPTPSRVSSTRNTPTDSGGPSRPFAVPMRTGTTARSRTWSGPRYFRRRRTLNTRPRMRRCNSPGRAS